MRVLPDVVAPGLRAVFVGTAVGDCQALAGHHHAVPADAFWLLLHSSGFTPRLLQPDEEDLLPTYGLGLVDLLPQPGRERPPVAFDVAGLLATVERLRPRWVVLTSKRTGAVVARALGQQPPSLGAVSWRLGSSEVFVVPSTSRANQRRDYDGRPTRLDWWAECAQTVLSAASSARERERRREVAERDAAILASASTDTDLDSLAVYAATAATDD